MFRRVFVASVATRMKSLRLPMFVLHVLSRESSASSPRYFKHKAKKFTAKCRLLAFCCGVDMGWLLAGWHYSVLLKAHRNWGPRYLEQE